MKKIIVALLFGFFGFAQETEFKFNKDGFTDYVVTEVPGKTQQELYKKVIDWVAVTYKNPKEVMLAQIENDYVRIEGSKEGLVCIQTMMNFCYPTRYQIEVSLKDGKYKFDLIKLEYYIAPSQYGAGGWYDYQLTDMKEYFKENGDAKGKFKKNIPQLTSYFNQLNKELESFLKLDYIPSKKSDW
jgi:hypothetical protein